ncbi:MAG: cytochrome c family protein [Gammaproteobacteria bacterium]|nr:cytochrome c family protein [Gammaproteobacteria bacterium]
MRHKKIRSSLLPLILLGGGLFGFSQSQAAEAIHHTSAETCQLCHKEIYKQWKGSMHANSTPLTDPIHAKFYQSLAGSPTEEGVKMKNGSYPVCLNCHAPNAARDGKTKIDAVAAYNEGVNCITCHTVKTFNGIRTPDGKMRLGIKAYTLSDNLQGAGYQSNFELGKLSKGGDMFGAGGDEQKPNPHLGEPVMLDGKEIPALLMESNPENLRTSDNCMGCHEFRPNGNGVPLCNTADEYASVNEKVDCLSCHMPVSSDGIIDHSIGGGHDPKMLAKGVVLTVKGEKQGNNINAVATMRNMQPHKLPTGAPFRNIYLTVKAYDASGNVVWSSSKTHPAMDDKQAYMTLTLLDDEGKPTSPPKATKLGDDTRLLPFESRSLNYTIPAKGVVLVRSELHYSLLWPGLVKQFDDLPKDLTAPTLIATAEMKI